MPVDIQHDKSPHIYRLVCRACGREVHDEAACEEAAGLDHLRAHHSDLFRGQVVDEAARSAWLHDNIVHAAQYRVELLVTVELSEGCPRGVALSYFQTLLPQIELKKPVCIRPIIAAKVKAYALAEDEVVEWKGAYR